ncbi:DUF308 domain-containing protein [Bacillus alveayuensis]|jgi:hypothetical protein|uniref:DUF4190 domain-containing protein n=1 Tax=Aeribacillus alveayuensis TaxID=279215 RepID=A0ABT9VKC7_9BACI|nr:hypothetical protein [Bacillus alveayuensis]
MANNKNMNAHGDKNFRERQEKEAIQTDRNYMEETAAQLDSPVQAVNEEEVKRDNERVNSQTMGYVALALSIISLFVLPVLLGAAGIVVGFMARRRGALNLGNWAIGIGIVSVLLGIFVLPFF